MTCSTVQFSVGSALFGQRKENNNQYKNKQQKVDVESLAENARRKERKKSIRCSFPSILTVV